MEAFEAKRNSFSNIKGLRISYVIELNVRLFIILVLHAHINRFYLTVVS